MIDIDPVDTYNQLQNLFHRVSTSIRGTLYWGNIKNSAFNREAAKGFAKFLSGVIAGNVPESSDLKSQLRPLSPRYVEWKAAKNYDLNIWIATGKLSKSIVTNDGNNISTVEVDPSAISYTDSNVSEKLTEVVKWIEEGNSALGIPERPLWNLTVGVFKASKLIKFENAIIPSIDQYVSDSMSSFRKSKNSIGDVASANVKDDFSVALLEKALNGDFGNDVREKEMVARAVKKGFS